MKKYLKVFWQFAKISLMNQMAYRPSFFLAVIGKICRMILVLIFFQVIYFNVSQIVGWDYKQIVLLVLTYISIESIAIVTFHRNLFYHFPDLLRKGTFDFIITKPVNTLFYTSFRIIDLMDLTSSFIIVFFWVYFLKKFSFNFSFESIILYILLVANALLFLFTLTLLVASLSFWTIMGTGLGRFFENVMRIARYPTDIFKGVFKFLLIYIIPISVIATVPVKTLLGFITWPYLIYAFGFTLILFLISLKFWNFALRHYTSASS